MTDDQTDKLQVRTIIRRWVEAELEAAEAIELPAVRDAVVRRLLANPALVQRALTALVGPTVYEVARVVLAQRRDLVPTGPERYETPARLAERLTRLTDRWQQWLEKGVTVHVPVVRMTRADLLAAAERRRHVAAHHTGVAAFFEALAHQLRDGQVVADVFSETELDHLYLVHTTARPATDLAADD
jgi:hypothetical protein